MSNCQKLTVRTVSHTHTTDDITDFVSGVSAIVIGELSGYSSTESDPIFTTWAGTYSANHNATYTAYSSNSGYYLTTQSGDVRYVNLSGDVMFGGLSAPTLSTDTLYVGASTIKFVENGTIVESLGSDDVTHFKSIYNTTGTSSANWTSAYNYVVLNGGEILDVSTVVKNNSSLWILSGSDPIAETDPIFTTWANTYSANHNLAYTNLISNSASYLTAHDLTLINSVSSNWSESYNTVNTNSAINWNYQGTDIKSISSNWQDVYTGFSSQSANNSSVYSTVHNTSGVWNNAATVYFPVSGGIITRGTNSTTPTTALILSNSALAINGTQSASPSLVFSSHGWKTGGTPGSQTVDFKINALPIQGTTSPNPSLVFSTAINGGATNNLMRLQPDGAVKNMGIDFVGPFVLSPSMISQGTKMYFSYTYVGFSWGSSDLQKLDNNGNYITSNGGMYGWSDLKIAREAANIIAQRNSTNPQIYQLYETYTNSSNNEYMEFNASNSVNTIKPVANGTGVASTIRYYTTPTTWFGSRAGSPEGIEIAGIGSICSDTTTGTLYRKTSGTGNTGWVTP